MYWDILYVDFLAGSGFKVYKFAQEKGKNAKIPLKSGWDMQQTYKKLQNAYILWLLCINLDFCTNKQDFVAMHDAMILVIFY